MSSRKISRLEPIAIVGAACRFPGHVTDLPGLWNILKTGTDAVTEIPAERFCRERFGSAAHNLAGHAYTFSAGIIENIKDFDPYFFGISRKEALSMDPQQWLALETTWEALENAHIMPSALRGTDTGVYMGSSNMDASMRSPDDPAIVTPYSMTGTTLGIVANRISYYFDWHGPSMTIDTACSSSLVAVHQACESLRHGEISLAVAGGVNALLMPYPFIGFSKARMLSPDGRCKVFDALGNGYVRSEGGGVILLKTLAQAIKDKDNVMAVIAGSGVNSDGRTTGIALPNQQAQMALLEKVYADFDLDRNKLVYVEAHGTGTAAGDPLEALAIGTMLGKPLRATRCLPVGSIKTNIGHLEPASGIAGLIKSLLVLEHGKIPANLHFNTPNPAINFDDLNLRVPTSLMDLPKAGGQELISINSFGFGGTNAHVVLQRAPKARRRQAKAVATTSLLPPVFLSARSSGSLRKMAGQYAALLESADAATYYATSATLALHRDHLNFRSVVTGTSVKEISGLLKKISKADADSGHYQEILPENSFGGGRGIFAFSGNGSQWCGMGATLLAKNEDFRAALEEVDSLLMPLQGWSVALTLQSAEANRDAFDYTEKCQPLLFAVQVGIVLALRARGITPAGVMGHSVGEVAAAWACGALSLQDACTVIHFRSMLQAPSRDKGGMAVVNLTEEAARPLLAKYNGSIEIAAVNTESSLTLSGVSKDLRALVDGCKQQRIAAKMLGINYPFHTAVMEQFRDELLSSLAGIKPGKPKIPFFSTAQPGKRGLMLDADYWWRNVRQPVLFEAGVRAAFAAGARMFMEIGPNPILRAYLRDIFHNTQEQTLVAATLVKGKNEHEELESCWKSAWQCGWKLDLTSRFPEPYEKQSLPAYPWDHEYLWSESTPENHGYHTTARVHPLLGWPMAGQTPVFENTIHLADQPWLADHRAGAGSPYPAAAFIETMLAAAAQIHPSGQQELEWVSIFRPLAMAEDSPKVIRVSVDKEDGGLVLEARPHMSAEAWSLYARGRILGTADTPTLSELHGWDARESFGVPVEKTALYESASRYLLHYGPAFRCVDKAWVRADAGHSEVLAQLGQPDPLSAEGMLVPPTLVDGAFQTLFILLGSQDRTGTHAYLPSAFEHVTLYAAGRPAYAFARLERVSPRSVVASFRLLDSTGKTLLHMRNCRFRRAPWLEHEKAPAQPYAVELRPQQNPAMVSPLTGISPQLLVKEAENVLLPDMVDSNDGVQSVPPYLLLQLASLCAIHETVLSRFEDPAQTPNFSCEELLESGNLAPTQEEWFRHMLERLEAAGLATRTPAVAPATGDRWQITRNEGRPTAKALWRTLVSTTPGFLPEATMLAHIYRQRRQILGGHFAGREQDVLPQRLVDAYFNNASSFQPFARALRRSLKTVLEAAKPGQTVQILQLAKSPEGLLPHVLPLLGKAPCTYVVAERDEATAAAHALLFNHTPEVRFTALSPEEYDGEHKDRYHLIIAACSLMEHVNSSAALVGVYSMLAPGGVLCLVEHSPNIFADYVFGAQPAWWSTSLDKSLPVSLTQDTSYWHRHMQDAGFNGITGSGLDNDKLSPAFMLVGQKSYAATSTLAAPAISGVEAEAVVAGMEQAVRWIVVAGKPGSQSAYLADALVAALQAQDCSVSLLGSDQTHEGTGFDPQNVEQWKNLFLAAKQKPKLHVVFAAGYDTRDDIGREELSSIQNLGTCGLAALAKAWDEVRPDMRLWVIAGGALADGLSGARPVPSQGAISGFSRVLMNEMRAMPIRFIDLHGEACHVHSALPALVFECMHSSAEPEVVLSQSMRSVPRLARLVPAQQNDAAKKSTGGTLTFDIPGRLQNLYWKQMSVPTPGDDEVCVEVRHTGLNFRDVMWCMGLLQDEALENGFSGPTMGLECSGVITSLGENVKGWSAGDEVVCFVPSGFSSHVVTKVTAIAPKPANLSFAEAATIPVPFITAWYSLKHLANMQPGEKVLIHGAAGGVGLAAIQIAHHLGLEVYATAGSAEKHSFLRQLGVTNLYSSRSLAFAQQIMNDTGGKGMDAVLNSLAGEAIPAGLSVLRPFGRFIELGKRDFYADTPMRLRPFSNNLSYFGVDVDQLLVHQPELAQKLFAELMDLFAERKLVPLPHTVFPAIKAVSAFQTMQQSAHIGKLVVAMDGVRDISRPEEPALKKIYLEPGATYLVSGGTNGFGLATAARLAQRGAKSLVLLSRSGAQGEESQKIIEGMRCGGAQVVVLKADVADAAKLGASLKKTLKGLPPLKGVIHAAAVLDDGIITSLTPERIQNSLAAKSLGAWNLHEATLECPLDFFVLFSSATTPFGNPGQSGYVAANCMLEALAAWRRKRKLPGQFIGWGPIADTGMITRNPKAQQMLLKMLGVSATHSADALNWLENAIAENIGGSHYFGLDWNSRAELPALSAPQFSLLRPLQATSRNLDGPSLDDIRACGPKEGKQLIAAILVDEIAHVLRMPKERLTPETPLVSQGMDSLTAVELTLAVEQKFELTGYTMALTDKTTALSLAESLYANMTGGENTGDAACQDEDARQLKALEEKHGIHLSEEQRRAVQDSIPSA